LIQPGLVLYIVLSSGPLRATFHTGGNYACAGSQQDDPRGDLPAAPSLPCKPPSTGQCLEFAWHGYQIIKGWPGAPRTNHPGRISSVATHPARNGRRCRSHAIAYEWDPDSPAVRLIRAGSLLSIPRADGSLATSLPEMHVWLACPSTGEIIDFTTGPLAPCLSFDDRLGLARFPVRRKVTLDLWNPLPTDGSLHRRSASNRYRHLESCVRRAGNTREQTRSDTPPVTMLGVLSSRSAIGAGPCRRDSMCSVWREPREAAGRLAGAAEQWRFLGTGPEEKAHDRLNPKCAS